MFYLIFKVILFNSVIPNDYTKVSLTDIKIGKFCLPSLNIFAARCITTRKENLRIIKENAKRILVFSNMNIKHPLVITKWMKITESTQNGNLHPARQISSRSYCRSRKSLSFLKIY